MNDITNGLYTKDQEALNQFTRTKLMNSIANTQPNANAALSRLIEEGKMAHDFILPMGANTKMYFDANGKLLMYFPKPEQDWNTKFELNNHAVGQLAERTGVPTRYLKGLAGSPNEWERNLAATILNQNAVNLNKRVLVRSVGEEVRGILSDSYRRLNSEQIVQAFLDVVYRLDAVMVDGLCTDTRFFLEVMIPTPFDIPTTRNGLVTLGFGARLSSSDYGNGALELRMFVKQGACLNGIVRESVMKQIHLGSKLPNNLALSEETYQLDTATTVSAIRDLTKGILAPEAIKREANLIQMASNSDMDFSNELKKLKKGGTVLDGEVVEIEKILMNGRREDGVDGGNSLWKFVNGITAHARDLGQEDPERRRELEKVAGDLLSTVKI